MIRSISNRIIASTAMPWLKVVTSKACGETGRFGCAFSDTCCTHLNTVPAGTTVTWTNNDATTHTVTADGSYTSGNLNQGATYSHTFSAAGTYPYHCNIHTMMKGTVVVQ